jgi:hypothetical protein
MYRNYYSNDVYRGYIFQRDAIHSNRLTHAPVFQTYSYDELKIIITSHPYFRVARIFSNGFASFEARYRVFLVAAKLFSHLNFSANLILSNTAFPRKLSRWNDLKCMLARTEYIYHVSQRQPLRVFTSKRSNSAPRDMDGDVHVKDTFFRKITMSAQLSGWDRGSV